MNTFNIDGLTRGGVRMILCHAKGGQLRNYNFSADVQQKMRDAMLLAHMHFSISPPRNFDWFGNWIVDK